MNLLVLGATGLTGRRVLTQALADGHTVTALVRDPARLPAERNLHVVNGDATDAVTLANAMRGQQAVLSTLGAGKNTTSTIASRAAMAIISAADETGVRRVVVLSAFGVGKTVNQASAPQRFVFKTMMKDIFADKAVADDLFRRSDLDYTLVYPVTLNDKAGNGIYRTLNGERVRGMPRIARTDVASFMLQEVATARWLRQTAILLP